MAAMLAVLYYSYYVAVKLPAMKERVPVIIPVVQPSPSSSHSDLHSDPTHRTLSPIMKTGLSTHILANGSSSGQDPSQAPVTAGLSVSPNADSQVVSSEERPTVHLYDQDMIGHLNYDVWKWIVGYTIDDMRFKRSFPNFPDERKMISVLKTHFSEKDPSAVRGKYAHKVYGYLLPSVTGNYFFSIEMTGMTAACTVELWLSMDVDPTSTSRLLILEYPELGRDKKEVTRKANTGEPFRLVASQPHYFEFLEKAFDGQCNTEIKWKYAEMEAFSSIPSDHFAMAVKLDSEGQFTDWPIVQSLQGPLPSNELQSHHVVQFVGDTIYPITDLVVLPNCDFHPTYTSVHHVPTYKGIYEVFESAVYPPDNTWHKNSYRPDKGNKRVDSAVADKVLRLYKKAFHESKQYTGEVLKIRYLEETRNRDKGWRFLLEMDIKLSGEDEIVHTSEYTYLPKDSEALCHTQNFQWTKDVDVHIVISVKNLGVWVKHLIHNMEYIYQQTHDERFQLIVVDYHSEELNIQKELEKSSLKRWKLIQKYGGFSRSGGLQEGVNYITDPNSIVMTIDMHLTLPPGFIEYTRRVSSCKSSTSGWKNI